MAYLDNTTIIVDAILTKKGRERLAEGRDNFKITQFALGDDEIDYSLWDPTNALGTNYYGAIIENMPLLEAFPDERTMMKSKLISMAKGTTKVPILSSVPTSFEVTSPQEGQAAGNAGVENITPNTANLSGVDSNLGYTLVVHDSTLLSVNVPAGQQVDSPVVGTVPAFLGDTSAQHTISAVGFQFVISAIAGINTDRTTQVTIIGNESGATKTIDVTVKKMTATGQANTGGGAS
tara:strand:- start:288 stop:992 length:705 start_codon:yes stop_codon:yes gene_type:complete